MLLKDLGQRYLDSVPALDKLLNRKKAELRKADRNGNFSEALALRNEIITIKEMKDDCSDIGHYLINYYEKGGK